MSLQLDAAGSVARSAYCLRKVGIYLKLEVYVFICNCIWRLLLKKKLNTHSQQNMATPIQTLARLPLIVKMSEYSKKKEEDIEWYSEPFYTHHQGYKMCLCVYPASWGDAMGSHLSVDLYLMKGSNDDQLKWPIQGQCEVELLNQIDSNEHYCGVGVYYDDGHYRVISGERNESSLWGNNKFIRNEDIYKVTSTCQYLKDDSIVFRVNYKLD